MKCVTSGIPTGYVTPVWHNLDLYTPGILRLSQPTTIWLIRAGIPGLDDCTKSSEFRVKLGVDSCDIAMVLVIGEVEAVFVS
jgi:hypothetical protein